MPEDWVVVKADFSNAFNSLHRRAILEAIASRAPDLYRYCHASYAASSSFFFGEFEISSEEEIQQGDPLGPLLFCLCVQPLLESIIAPLRIGYIDDLTLGGPAPMVAQAVEDVKRSGEPLGLMLNCIVSYRIVSYRIVSYRIVSYRIVSYRIVSYRIVSYRIVSYRIVSYRIVSYRIVLYCTVLYCIVLYCIVLYCIVLYCIVLYCIVLYCIVLYSGPAAG